jgi:hypothetical protein
LIIIFSVPSVNPAAFFKASCKLAIDSSASLSLSSKPPDNSVLNASKSLWVASNVVDYPVPVTACIPAIDITSYPPDCNSDL